MGIVDAEYAFSKFLLYFCNLCMRISLVHYSIKSINNPCSMYIYKVRNEIANIFSTIINRQQRSLSQTYLSP